MIISANNLNHLKQIKETFSTQINKSMNNFQTHLEKLQIENGNKDRLNAEKTFNKFEKSVSNI